MHPVGWLARNQKRKARADSADRRACSYVDWREAGAWIPGDDPRRGRGVLRRRYRTCLKHVWRRLGRDRRSRSFSMEIVLQQELFGKQVRANRSCRGGVLFARRVLAGCETKCIQAAEARTSQSGNRPCLPRLEQELERQLKLAGAVSGSGDPTELRRP